MKNQLYLKAGRMTMTQSLKWTKCPGMRMAKKSWKWTVSPGEFPTKILLMTKIFLKAEKKIWESERKYKEEISALKCLVESNGERRKKILKGGK